MEYVKGGPVMNVQVESEPLPEEKAKKYFCDVVKGLEYSIYISVILFVSH
jgi:serine/threonine protein kinase